MLGASEPARRRKKDPDRERSSPKSRDKEREKGKERHKSSRSHRSRKPRSSGSKDDDENEDEDDEPKARPREPASKERSSRTSSSSQTPKSPKPPKMNVVPEMDRRGSVGSRSGSRTNLSYPTFSKTHSKENIYSKEELAERSRALATPEATDAGDEGQEGQETGPQSDAVPKPPTRAPPSPPLTATSANDLRKTASANSMRRKPADAVHREMEGGRRSVESGTRLTPEPRFTASRSSIREDKTMEGTDMTSTTSSQPSTVRAKSPKAAPPRVRTGGRASPAAARAAVKEAAPAKRGSSPQASATTQSTDSDATSRPPAPPQNPRRLAEDSSAASDTSPASVVDSSPQTPTHHSSLPSVLPSAMPAAVKTPGTRPPTVEIADGLSRAQSEDRHRPLSGQSPMAPPPPPPPVPAMSEAPRVDYLLQNGGLPRPVPRSLLAAMDNAPVPLYSRYSPPQMSESSLHDVKVLFNPLRKLLEDYIKVLDSNGSIASATGYRTVARRLLDRLEVVFARSLNADDAHCACLWCLQKYIPDDDDAGVSWGLVFEFLSGRYTLPAWPPFDQTTASGLGISDLEAPCQRMDVDVPENSRTHFQQQSRRTQMAVQSWLSNQEDAAPEEADDETLTFAMLTRLDPSDRPLFYALLYGLDDLPSPRSRPVPDDDTPEYLDNAILGLQRLYRLSKPPREQVAVMYLIRNPDMHDILATLSSITAHEWEILISGRFDGFLWSGAEDTADAQPSSEGQPFSPASSSRPGSTRPGSTRPSGPAPIQMDEDTEMAVVAEVEREIYHSMEALEDAFEQLHLSAEYARNRLRQRNTALAMAAQARRGGGPGGIEVRAGTPAVDTEVGEGLEDLRSDVGPDDSASNVSNNRRRRGHRTRQRRTPAPVEEESEVDSTVAERVRRVY